MDKLIRRALLGVQEAQRECTEKGIMLPCPCCGGEADTWRSGNTAFVECSACGLTMQNIRESYVLANWNTRPAPPIGRCRECKHGIPYKDAHIMCKGRWADKDYNGFCDNFEPKEDNSDG